jgi:hypothetical protein
VDSPAETAPATPADARRSLPAESLRTPQVRTVFELPESVQTALRDLASRIASVEGSATEVGDFANDLQRQLNQQRAMIVQIEAAAKDAAAVADAAKAIAAQQRAAPDPMRIDDIFKSPLMPTPAVVLEPTPPLEEEDVLEKALTITTPRSAHEEIRQASSSINQEAFLEDLLTAVRPEIEKARRQALDESTVALRTFQQQTSGALQKATALVPPIRVFDSVTYLSVFRLAPPPQLDLLRPPPFLSIALSLPVNHSGAISLPRC